MKRLTALLLSLLLLFGAALPAAAEEAPADWARPALDFCVENGLMSSDDLRPAEPATRAELAAMVVRLLQAEGQAELTAADVNPQAWYYEELSAAVSIGVYEGTGSALRPLDDLTRQEAMTVLARAFGVPDGREETMETIQNSYRDGWSMDLWAVGPVSGLVEAGYVQGSNAYLRPLDTISRQELAQLIWKLAGTTAAQARDLPDSGNVVWTGGDLSNRTVDGSLFLAGSGDRTLRNVDVSGRIVVYGGSLELAGGTTAEAVVVSGDAEVDTGGTVPVRVRAGNAVISGGGTVSAAADTVLKNGTYESIVIDGAAVTVETGAAVAAAELTGQGSVLTGSGRVDSAVVRGEGCTVETEDTPVTEEASQQLTDASLTLTVMREATPSVPTIELSVRLTGVQGTGTGVLSWYGGGVLGGRDLVFPLEEGASTVVAVPADYAGRLSPEQLVTVQLTAGDETVTASTYVNQHIEQMTSPVRTLEVEAVVLRDTGLYSSMYLSGRIGTVPAGTTATYINYSGRSAAKLLLDDGTTGWVRWSDVSISGKDYVQYTDYDTVTKENFVNIHGYASETELLVWVSLLTQKVNVFTGGQGNWQLLHTFPCTTGKNTTPTISGVFRYQYRQNYWDFGSYYVNRPMIFNGGHAFHTRTYIKGTTSLLDPTMGSTASQGCVRMLDADVDWLWDHMPFGTTVVVF